MTNSSVTGFWFKSHLLWLILCRTRISTSECYAVSCVCVCVCLRRGQQSISLKRQIQQRGGKRRRRRRRSVWMKLWRRRWRRRMFVSLQQSHCPVPVNTSSSSSSSSSAAAVCFVGLQYHWSTSCGTSSTSSGITVGVSASEYHDKINYGTWSWTCQQFVWRCFGNVSLITERRAVQSADSQLMSFSSDWTKCVRTSEFENIWFFDQQSELQLPECISLTKDGWL